MGKYLFYIKECLFNPIVFFRHCKENPSIIQMPWVLVPIAIFLLFVSVHWFSTTIITKNIQLDFSMYLFFHMNHLFVGLFFTVLIWFRSWITLKYIGNIQNYTKSVTAWCITPYLIVLPILLIALSIYIPIFGQDVKIPTNENVSITEFQQGTSLIRVAVVFSDIWIILLIFTAVTVINPIRSKASLIGGILIFLLPSLIFITFR
jgi:hypothetical protein